MAQDLTCSNENYNVGSSVWKPLNPPLGQISLWQEHSGLGDRYSACKTIPSNMNFNYECILNDYLIHSSKGNIIFRRKNDAMNRREFWELKQKLHAKSRWKTEARYRIFFWDHEPFPRIWSNNSYHLHVSGDLQICSDISKKLHK